jgi:hypothetical protein
VPVMGDGAAADGAATADATDDQPAGAAPARV